MKFKLFSKSDFFKNVLTLATGATLSSGIPILAYFFLTRIYTPSDFGTLSVFVSVYSILAVIGTGKYELAIPLPEKKEDAVSLVFLCLILNTAFSVFLLLIILLFYDQIVHLIGNENLKGWVYFFPVLTFLLGTYQTFYYYNLRIKSFKEISKSKIYKSTTLSFFQIALGVLKFTSFGLILGNIISNFSSNINLIKTFIVNEGLYSYKKITKQELKTVAKEHINFPKFTLISTLLNTASVQIPILLFSVFFTTSFIGQFSISHKVLSMPMILLGGAIGQVYYQRITDSEFVSDEYLKQITWKLYKILLLVGVLPLSVIFFFGDYIFAFAFGEKWLLAGVYSKPISIWVLFVFISSPLSSILFAKGYQKQALIFQIFVFLSRVIIIYVCAKIGIDELTMINYYSVAGFLLYLFLVFYVFLKIKIPLMKVFKFTFIVFSSVFSVLKIIQILLE
ncbi:lipopolysaccharide biosynthesis protein [Tenacibaculum finnmarkense]|uniref:lipopolysaccharide biosynthesis protein n=1 Tax=Tenacibaculum finnmarkense TaxID=2781243 RepID=UPI001E5C9127|nr:oligosaccharide flippase family protein [Tenacibaculum finnmarkense]MCD8423124.1 oligosaccharide flippase family protein [Tenacibaculum finnmarkense genomovar ulcerans]MCD8443584.1 oligosaccharide flippase family protein [Tenacibaculum finnmarkense genomovar ulcerans]MCG8239339.1 oligosaccharide flippase family protein [Tenacibaculum finnmarkense genomovar ulcerans]MCG8796167.1 oligosaccharide flippase family protein [Tenacibaculum finnmarkense]MCG8798275.1 oligosaccharide flippase family p